METQIETKKQYIVTDEEGILLDLNRVNGKVVSNRLYYMYNNLKDKEDIALSSKEKRFYGNKINDIYMHDFLSIKMFSKSFYVDNNHPLLSNCKFYTIDSQDFYFTTVTKIDRNLLHLHLEDETTVDSLMFLSRFSTNQKQLEDMYKNLGGCLLENIELSKPVENIYNIPEKQAKEIRLKILKNPNFKTHQVFINEYSDHEERLAIVENPTTLKSVLLSLASEDKSAAVLYAISKNPRLDSDIVEALMENITEKLDKEYARSLISRIFNSVTTYANKKFDIDNNCINVLRFNIISYIERYLNHFTNIYDITSKDNEEDITISVTIKKR